MNIQNDWTREVVCVSNDDGSTLPCRKNAHVLTVGKLYTVVDVEVHSWHTLVRLQEFPGREFNSVLFEEIEDVDPSLILMGEKACKALETLPQYHFERNDFTKVMFEVFTNDEFVDIDVTCGTNEHLDEFSLFRWEDEFYILHRNSGVMINWYKHAGRTNTCNKPDFTLDDFRCFLKKLREDLVWNGVIKDDLLMEMMRRRDYDLEE